MERPVITGRLALFAECVITGLWFTLAALPLVTVLPAFAAACRHLDRFRYGYRAGLREFAADVQVAWRGSWRATTPGLAALALLVADLAIARSGLPGGTFMVALSGLGILFVCVAGMRAAAAWRPGADWWSLLRDALRRTPRPDSLLLAAGLAVLVVGASWLPPLFIPAAGCLAGAALSVHNPGEESSCAPSSPYRSNGSIEAW